MIRLDESFKIDTIIRYVTGRPTRVIDPEKIYVDDNGRIHAKEDGK